jgi:hypothetical protein
MPGPSTVANAAHNVNIDILAYGGWPLFLTYVAMMVLIIIAILRVTFRSNKYDPIFISLSVGWICYQIQAAISINQIGLAIWGWLLGGSLIAYEIATRDTAVIENISPGKKIKKNTKKKEKKGKLNTLKEKIEQRYHYLTAELDYQSGGSNLYSKLRDLHYTLENLYIVGPLTNLTGENATLILSFKS